MKGVIFSAVQSAIERNFGDAIWDQIIDDAELSGAYTSLGNYDDAELVATAIEMASVAANQDRELNARTKATILTLDTVTESNQAVDYEIHPQLWSMGQPPFRELVTKLQKDISSKDG